MGKEIITAKQGISIIVLFVVGSAAVLSPGSDAKHDVWISLTLAVLMAFSAVFTYARILSNFPGKDLFDILPVVLGKLPGSIVGLLYVGYSFYLGALVIKNFTEFIQIVSLPLTPPLVIVFFVGVVCIWAVRAGLEVFGRWAGFVLPLLVVIIAIIVILSLTQAEVKNLKPILYNGFGPDLRVAYTVFSFPFAETVIFTLVFFSVKNKFNAYKVYGWGIGIGFIILLVLAVRNLLVLGVETGALLYFPSYSAVSLINLGNFLQRTEIIVSVVFLFAGVSKTGICLYAASNGIAKIFRLGSHSTMTAPIGLLMMCLSCFVFNSTMEMFEWAEKIYPYFAMPFQVIFPIIIFIAAEIKVRSAKRNKSK